LRLHSTSSARHAFSLIELLVSIAVIGLLAAIAFPAISAARASADRASAVSQLRQIGIAVHAYAGDHSGLLPGPLWPGQIPVLDPQRSGRLARELAPYLSVRTTEEPQTVALFIPPAYAKSVTDIAPADMRTYVANLAIEMPDGSTLDAFGNLAHSPNPEPPKPLSSVPPSAWMLSDADQRHPRVIGAPWQANTPALPIHGAARHELLFSGAVVRRPAG
jgi:prepilin-type N-terminal cleavage/methylation domain-containing protein